MGLAVSTLDSSMNTVYKSGAKGFKDGSCGLAHRMLLWVFFVPLTMRIGRFGRIVPFEV